MKYVKHFFLAVTFLALGGFTWWAGMNYTGYCHAQGRYLSDEEKINSAVSYIISHGNLHIRKTKTTNINGSSLESFYWYAPENTINYVDINDFFKENPGCCRLSMSAADMGEGSLIERLTGYFSSYVNAKYKVKYIENGIENVGYGESNIAIKNCGAILTD